MFALVVRSVRTQRNPISIDGKYLEDHLAPFTAGKLYGKQLGVVVSSLHRVKLHDPNTLLVYYNLAICWKYALETIIFPCIHD